MRTGLVSSSALHAAILGVMLVSFASPRPFDVPPAESMPIDIVSEDELSKMMAGSKTEPKAETQKPLAEKIDAPKPVEDAKAKVSEKPEVKAASEPPPPPPPQPEAKPPEPKPPAPKAEVAKPQPSVPPKEAEALKPDPAPKKEEPKPELQQAQLPEQAPVPPKKPPPPKLMAQAPPKEQPTFDANRIAALLDKRTPQRQLSAGATLSNTPPLGTALGNSARLSQNELDALRARLAALWSPPAGAANPEELIVTVELKLNIDGTLAGPPMVVTSGSSNFYMAARESAIRAVFRGQPFDMLSPATYEAWKDIQITFDPREMLRG